MPYKTVLDCDTDTVTVSELTDAEIASLKSSSETSENNAEDQRNRRNTLLKQSDWSQGADVPTSIKSNWTDYRQRLRDVPAQSGFPETITWPAEPS